MADDDFDALMALADEMDDAGAPAAPTGAAGGAKPRQPGHAAAPEQEAAPDDDGDDFDALLALADEVAQPRPASAAAAKPAPPRPAPPKQQQQQRSAAAEARQQHAAKRQDGGIAKAAPLQQGTKQQATAAFDVKDPFSARPTAEPAAAAAAGAASLQQQQAAQQQARQRQQQQARQPPAGLSALVGTQRGGAGSSAPAGIAAITAGGPQPLARL
jgi:hypothetical protein